MTSTDRTLSRAKLVRALEGLSKYHTGLTRPISFGPNLHAGVRGTHVVAVDLQRRAFGPDPVWIGLD